MKHKGYNSGGDNSLGNDLAQKWKFGGKELDESLGLETYDFGARNYNPDLGRWMNIDPLAHRYDNTSPYVYTLNNPIFFIDPDGKKVKNGDEERKKRAEEKQKRYDKQLAEYKKNFGTRKKDFGGNEKAFENYKSVKKASKQNQRKIKEFGRRAEETDKRIADLADKEEKIFNELDNLENAEGEEVDLFFTTDPSFVENNGETPFAFIEKDGIKKPGSEFGINTVMSAIAEKSFDNTSTIFTMKHEGGHAEYQAEHTQAYYEWLDSRGLVKKPGNYDGHGKGDPSGQRAKEFENRNN